MYCMHGCCCEIVKWNYLHEQIAQNCQEYLTEDSGRNEEMVFDNQARQIQCFLLRVFQ